jgi:hypothetical protein
MKGCTSDSCGWCTRLTHSISFSSGAIACASNEQCDPASAWSYGGRGKVRADAAEHDEKVAGDAVCCMSRAYLFSRRVIRLRFDDALHLLDAMSKILYLSPLAHGGPGRGP